MCTARGSRHPRAVAIDPRAHARGRAPPLPGSARAPARLRPGPDPARVRGWGTIHGVESLRGQLLLAAPSLMDPNFHRTVVLIGEHTGDGALGVVLNRPSALTVGEAVPALEPALEGDNAVYVGGPVAPNAIMFLAEFVEPSFAALLVFGRIGLLSSQSELDELPSATDRGRVFAGHAGWGPGRARRGARQRRPGSPSRRCRRTSSPTTRQVSGARCSRARADASRCWHACHPIPR